MSIVRVGGIEIQHITTEIGGRALVKGLPEERAIRLAQYIIEQEATVRQAAAQFGISKSTVHTEDGVRNKTVKNYTIWECGDFWERSNLVLYFLGFSC